MLKILGHEKVEFSFCDGDLPLDHLKLFESKILSIDTETNGLDFAENQLQLIQIFDPKAHRAYLIKPSCVRPSNLCGLLEDQSFTKVFHHAMFDLRFLISAFDTNPLNIFCTKAAWKIYEPNRTSFSLKELVSALIGLELPKPTAIQTSDWAGSLSDEQLEYAILDVLYLAEMMEELQLKITNSQSIRLLQATMQFLPYKAELEVKGFPDVFSY